MSRITYLEDSLHADVEGKLKDEIVAHLERAEAGLRAQLRTPRTSVEFAAIERCIAASAAARAVIEVVWERYSGSATSCTTSAHSRN